MDIWIPLKISDLTHGVRVPDRVSVNGGVSDESDVFERGSGTESCRCVNGTSFLFAGPFASKALGVAARKEHLHTRSLPVFRLGL